MTRIYDVHVCVDAVDRHTAIKAIEQRGHEWTTDSTWGIVELALVGHQGITPWERMVQK